MVFNDNKILVFIEILHTPKKCLDMYEILRYSSSFRSNTKSPKFCYQHNAWVNNTINDRTVLDYCIIYWCLLTKYLIIQFSALIYYYKNTVKTGGFTALSSRLYTRNVSDGHTSRDIVQIVHQHTQHHRLCENKEIVVPLRHLICLLIIVEAFYIYYYLVIAARYYLCIFLTVQWYLQTNVTKCIINTPYTPTLQSLVKLFRSMSVKSQLNVTVQHSYNHVLSVNNLTLVSGRARYVTNIIYLIHIITLHYIETSNAVIYIIITARFPFVNVVENIQDHNIVVIISSSDNGLIIRRGRRRLGKVAVGIFKSYAPAVVLWKSIMPVGGRVAGKGVGVHNSGGSSDGHASGGFNEEVIWISIGMSIAIVILITIALCYLARQRCKKRQEISLKPKDRATCGERCHGHQYSLVYGQDAHRIEYSRCILRKTDRTLFAYASFAKDRELAILSQLTVASFRHAFTVLG
ncbi:hypothetical protein QTP88_018077 [Uroleucon formosanum]